MERKLIMALLAGFCFSAISAFGQSATFRADQLTVSPTLTGTAKCVQVGIYMTTTGVGNDQDWQEINVQVDYTDPDNILSGTPVVKLSDFVGSNSTVAGISNPGTPLSGSSCAAGAIINNATLGGSSANYMGNEATPASAGNLGFLIEDVNTGTKRITLSRLHTSTIFRTDDGVEYLIAILEFPLVAGAALSDMVLVNFVGGAGNNYINRATRESIEASTTNGYVLVFEPQDCSGATVADNYGSATGSNININYRDVQIMGTGGNITLTMPHASNDPDQIRIVPSDGSGEIIIAAADVGSGSTSLVLATSMDSTPSLTPASVTYQIFYGLNNPLAVKRKGSPFIEGDPCTVTVTWAAPTCTVVFDSIPVVGQATNADVTLTNARYTNLTKRGTSAFGVLTGPNSVNVNLSAPSSTSGNVLTFDNALAIGSVSAANVGNYEVDVFGAGNQTGGCSVFLGLECPTNNTSCPAGTVTIGGSVMITLSATNVADWDIIYNGTTVNLPGNTANYNLTNLVGNVRTLVIRANGFDSKGDPCSDDVNCTLNFANPTCEVAKGFENPTNCPDGVDPGTVFPWSVVTTGALSVTVGGVSFTPNVNPNTNNNVVWTGNLTATTIATINAVAAGPTGTTSTTSCSFQSCLNTFVVNGNAVLTPTGVAFSGTPSFTFSVYAIPGTECVDIDGSNPVSLASLGGSPVLVGSITTNASGEGFGEFGEDLNYMPDACYYIVSNGIVYGGTNVSTVPTLGEWGMIAFITALMLAGVVYMRRNRLA